MQENWGSEENHRLSAVVFLCIALQCGCACRDLRLALALHPQIVRNIAEQVVILVHNLQLEHGERLDERRLGFHDNRLRTSCAVANQSRRPAVSLLQRRLGAHMPLFHIVQIACAHHHLAG